MDCRPLLDEFLELLGTVNHMNRDLAQNEGRGALGNLSAIQIHALIAIWRSGVMNMSELADHLVVTRPQLTKIVDALEACGLIARRANPDSRREVLIALTGQGQDYIADSLLGESGFLCRVLAAASEEEIDELRRAVSSMRRIFAKIYKG